MIKASMVFAAFVVFLAVWVSGLPLSPLVIRRTIHDTISVVQTVPLHTDTLRLMERAGNPSCALPAVVVTVANPLHEGGRLGVPHGHYRVQANVEALPVVALPPNAQPGDVVCVLEVD